MAKFSSENQPNTRGKSFKTKLIDAIQRESLLEAKEGESQEKTEERFLSHMAKRAFDPDDQASATLLKELLSKSYASLKSTLPTIEFDFDATKTPAEQVTQLMDAASQGILPPDVAITFVHAIKAAVDIEESTDLRKRIEELERIMNG